MSSEAERKAASVGGVVIHGSTPDATGLTGILYRGTASTSNTPLTFPSRTVNGAPWIDVQGKFLNIFSATFNVQYAFGVGSAPALVYDQDVTIGTGSVVAGGTVPAGSVYPVLIPDNATHVSIIAAGATGKVELYVSEYGSVQK